MIIVLLIGMGVAFTPHRAPFTALDYGVFLVALAVGAAGGWWRAKTVRLSVDPATREVTSTTSPIGLLIIAAVFAVRFGLRSAAGLEATWLHMDPAVIEDGLLLLAMGLVVAQRVEIFLRARRLLDGTAGPAAMARDPA